MNEQDLFAFDVNALAVYLRERLTRARLDPPLDPRTNEGPPAFLLRALRHLKDEEQAEFSNKLCQAIRISFGNLATHIAEKWAKPSGSDSAADEWLAGLSYLAQKLEATSVLSMMEVLAVAWLGNGTDKEPSFGVQHLIRSIAYMQQGKGHEGFWEELWAHRIPELTPLILFGWARCKPEAALRQLPGLVRAQDGTALANLLWSLLASGGPSPIEVGRALAHDAELHQQGRLALERAGASRDELRDYDLPMTATGPAAGAFPFPPEAKYRAQHTEYVGWDVNLQQVPA